MSYKSLVTCALVTTAIHAADLAPNQVVTLDSNYSFRVEIAANHQVSVSLYYSSTEPGNSNLVERYTYGNGEVRNGDVKRLELDASNESPEYVVAISDRTSTFGAQTGLILWRQGASWRIAIIPSSKFSIDVRDQRSLIKFDGNTFYFKNGIFASAA